MTENQTNKPLFIGRFQPFHLGHLDAVRQILAKHGFVIIGIGSAQYFNLPENPYSAEIREKMIKLSLKEAGISPESFAIFQIPDIHNNEEWVSHVERLIPSFGEVYSGTHIVKELFECDGKHKVVTPKFNINISGTEIRGLMKAGKSWKEFVPEAVAEILSS